MVAVREPVGDISSLDRARTLASLVGVSTRPDWQTANMDVRKINALTQVRKTVTGIEHLVSNMDELGNLEPMLLVRYTRRQALEYLRLINEEWGTNHEIADLVSSDNSRTFYIIIAGHRRLNAIRQLGWKSVEVRCCSNIDPVVALFIQLSENLHMPVPRCEEAIGRIRLYLLVLRQRGGSFTLREYSAYVGVSVDQLRDELKFVHLPEEIRRAAEDGEIPFSIAVEFDRLIKEWEANERVRSCFPALDSWIGWLVDVCLKKAIAEKLSLEKFQREAKYEIKMELGRQLSIFELDGVGDKKCNHQSAMIARINDGVLGAIKMLSGILGHFKKEGGLFRAEESPLMDRPFRRLVRELIGLLDKLVPHLSFLLEEEKRRLQRKTKEAIRLIDELDLQ